ncbi:efflux RND transporter periplasmic adaptor subunit [Reichenbachiella sp.]|uniref:efflux RND transporter periplasmic adaptor subunit n=1 Tax=Reichenbachiella sp. TaxID=2184521 RepID=UPI003BAECE9B
MNLRQTLMVLILSVIIVSCKEKQATVIPPQKLPVVKVSKTDVPLYRQFVGQVFGLKDIPIRARVEGFLEGIYFTEGVRVEKGKLLYAIDPEPFKAEVSAMQANLAEAQTMLANAENELERYKPLAEINAVSKSDLDFAQSKRDAAVASVNAAKGNLRMSQINLGYCRISSPITGFIGKTNAREGEFVGRDPNPVILNTVSRIDTIRVQFFLTESEYLTIARYVSNNREELKSRGEDGRKESLTLILSDGIEHPFKGSVDFINREVDATTGAILVQGSFPNPNLIVRPGQFGRVRVKMDDKKDAITIPQRCVSELQGQYSVFVVDKEGTVQARQVKVGERMDDLWMISEGLKEGELVVLEGVQKVRTGDKVIPEVTEFKSVSLK